jgi:LysM repeat protein
VKTLNPFDGPGSLKAERQHARRHQFKIAIWAILAANVVLFTGLLIQGCRREPAPTETTANQSSEPALADTNGAPVSPPPLDTNAPIAPAFEPPTVNPPAEPATNSAAAPVQIKTRQYSVVKGDTLYKIAKANGVSLQALEAANPGVDSAKLKIGQVLQLPASGDATVASASASPTLAKATTTASSNGYVVKRGDTLGRIARRHGTTVQAIKMANGLTSDRIVVGRTLKLPQSQAAGGSGAQG